MNQHAPGPPEVTAHRNLRRLFMLRNVEIAAIAAGIIGATVFFDIGLPLPALLMILAVASMINVYTRLRLNNTRPVSDLELFVQMLLDVAALTGVFYFTGGASNPFVWFYLLPLMIAATILPRSHTWAMAALTVLCYSALFMVETPATDPHAHHHAEGFQMHVLGMWLGFVMSAGFVAVIIVGMAHSLRERDRRLAEAREQALRNERLVELGTLATGTAHELGTPLGTMAILLDELQQEYTGPEHAELGERLGMLRRQIDRCKQALSSLSAAAGAERAESGHLMPVRAWLQDVVDEWQLQKPFARLDTHFPDRAGNGLVLAERTLNQALVSILNNAADVSPDSITLAAECSDTELVLEISDRGPGLSSDIHSRLGKKPVTTKQEGLGVGLYLAYATIERLGGQLAFRNREGGGTVLTVTVPLLQRPGGRNDGND